MILSRNIIHCKRAEGIYTRVAMVVLTDVAGKDTNDAEMTYL